MIEDDQVSLLHCLFWFDQESFAQGESRRTRSPFDVTRRTSARSIVHTTQHVRQFTLGRMFCRTSARNNAHSRRYSPSTRSQPARILCAPPPSALVAPGTHPRYQSSARDSRPVVPYSCSKFLSGACVVTFCLIVDKMRQRYDAVRREIVYLNSVTQSKGPTQTDGKLSPVSVLSSASGGKRI
jgi:hypothetical protein